MGRWVEEGRWRVRPELVPAWPAVVTASCAVVPAVLGVVDGQTWGIVPVVAAAVGFAIVAVV